MENMLLSEIIEKSNDEICMDFCGEKITISSSKFIYSKLRVKYYNLTIDACLEFNKEMYKLFYSTDFDNVTIISNYFDVFIKCAMPIINSISEDAISANIYTLDKERIVNYCDTHGFFNGLYEYRDAICNKAYELAEQHAAAAAARELNKEYRPRMKQMTISNRFGDFLKNQIKTDISNLAMGAVYSLFNSYSNANSLANAQSELKSYIRSSQTALFDIATEAYGKIQRVFWNMLTNDLRIYVFTENADDCEKSTPMFNNLQSLNLPIDKQYDLARQIIKLCPSGREYYFDFFDRFPKYQKEIFLFAQKFGIDLSIKVLPAAQHYISERSYTDSKIRKVL